MTTTNTQHENSQTTETPEVPLLEILYQDEWLVAINKPAGMLVHRSFLDKHETVFVLQTLRNQLGRHVFPLHRLDRPTSGVLLFALSSEVAAMMNNQQAWRKLYLATVRGYLQQAQFLDYPLVEQLDAIADKHARTDKAAQQAQTQIWPLATMELPFADSRHATSRYSLVYLQPMTGRKHQLRRHLAHLRHPILGDTTHGDNKNNRRFSEFSGFNRLHLHALALQLTHPILATELLIESPLPDFYQYFKQVIQNDLTVSIPDAAEIMSFIQIDLCD